MQIQPLNLPIEGTVSFIGALNQAISFIVREINKIQSELSKPKSDPYVKADKKYHPLRGKVDVSFRASSIRLAPRPTVPDGTNVLFVDSADGLLKFKDENSVVQPVT